MDRRRRIPAARARLPFGPTTAPDPEPIRALKAAEQRQLPDPFRNVYAAPAPGERVVIEPAFNLMTFLRLPTENSILGPCIDAMVCNVAGHGYQLDYTGPDGQEDSPQAQDEKQAIENLLDAPNGDVPLQETLERIVRDRETVGLGAAEIGRNGKGEVVMFAHVPGHTLRMTTRDAEAVAVRVSVVRNGKRETLTVKKRFRRFVQMVNEKRVYFKEFGDPRRIDPNTGDVVPGLSLEDSATEILALPIYSPGYVYGLPRWMCQLPAILGGRQAELTNLDYFQSNAVPAMALLVSGGLVTGDSITELDNTLTASRGRASQNRIVIIEVEGTGTIVDDKIQAPKVELKPLHGDRQGDALFADYEKAGEQKVRAAFRLPPLMTGHSEDHTYATAATSFEVAESQIFGPERSKIETALRSVLATLNPLYWTLKLNPPSVADPAAFGKLLESLDKVGAMTPNAAVAITNQQLGLDLPRVQEAWGDAPFAFSLHLAQTGRLKGLKAMTEAPALPPAPVPPPAPTAVQRQAYAAEAVRAVRDSLLALRAATVEAA